MFAKNHVEYCVLHFKWLRKLFGKDKYTVGKVKMNKTVSEYTFKSDEYVKRALLYG